MRLAERVERVGEQQEVDGREQRANDRDADAVRERELLAHRADVDAALADELGREADLR